MQQVSSTAIEIETKILYPQESKPRLRQIVNKVQAWLIARAMEGGLEAARTEPGHLNYKEYRVLQAVVTMVPEGKKLESEGRTIKKGPDNNVCPTSVVWLTLELHILITCQLVNRKNL